MGPSASFTTSGVLCSPALSMAPQFPATAKAPCILVLTATQSFAHGVSHGTEDPVMQSETGPRDTFVNSFMLLIQKNTVYTGRRESTLAGTMLLLWLWNMPCTMMDPMLHNESQRTVSTWPSKLLDAHISWQEQLVGSIARLVTPP